MRYVFFCISILLYGHFSFGKEKEYKIHVPRNSMYINIKKDKIIFKSNNYFLDVGANSCNRFLFENLITKLNVTEDKIMNIFSGENKDGFIFISNNRIRRIPKEASKTIEILKSLECDMHTLVNYEKINCI